MRYLSLFSGIGLGDLGLQTFCGLECMGYVEIEEYCQKVIRQRQEDGILGKAKIFSDIRDKEYLEASSNVDLVTAGFP